MKFYPDGIKKDVIPSIQKGIAQIDKVDLYSINSGMRAFGGSGNLYRCIEQLATVSEDLYVLANKLEVSTELYDKAEKKNEEIIEQLFLEDIDYHDYIFADENGRYGVAQQFFDDAEHDSIKKVSEVCNMSYKDAVQYCMYLNSLGACSYATYANVIVDLYKDDPIQFEKDFGYPLYSVSKNGNVVCNGELVMAELFLYYNSVQNGGELLTVDKDGRNTFVEDAIVSRKTGEITNDPYEEKSYKYTTVRMAKVAEPDQDVVKYLDKKGTSKRLKNSNYFISKKPNKTRDAEQMKTFVKQELNKDNTYMTCTLWADKKSIVVQDMKTGEKYEKKDFMHIVEVVDADDNGIYLASDGTKYFIAYEELEKCKECEFESFEYSESK